MCRNPLSGYKGGRIFRNFEGLLPKGATYHEYDVRPLVPGAPRNAVRIVVDATRTERAGIMVLLEDYFL